MASQNSSQDSSQNSSESSEGCPDYRYAMLFEETPNSKLEEGYLFVDQLDDGGCSSGVMLVRSVSTGKLYARKYIAPVNDELFILETEVEITQDLTDSGISPRLHSAFMNGGGDYRACVTEFCNGGDAENWFFRYGTPENREFMAWLVLVETTRALTYLHSEQATRNGAIFHGDLYTRNIFLHFEAGDPIPRIIIGDYGISHYQNKTLGKRVYNSQRAAEFSYIGDVRYALAARRVNPPVAKSLEKVLSLSEYPKCMKIRSAQELLEEIEEEGTARMGYLKSQPGFHIPRPRVREYPWSFEKPDITVSSHKDLEELPQSAPGEPRWRWVKIDWSDKTFRTFEILPDLNIWDSE